MNIFLIIQKFFLSMTQLECVDGQEVSGIWSVHQEQYPYRQKTSVILKEQAYNPDERYCGEDGTTLHI